MDDAFPNGFLLELDGFPRCSMVSYEEYQSFVKEYLAKFSKNKTYCTSFGNFSSIALQEVDGFKDYRTKANKAYTWPGSQQAIFLYPIGNERKFSITKGTDEKRPFMDGTDETRKLLINGVKTEKPFFAVSFFHVSVKAKENVDSYEGFLKKCKEKINETVDKFNKECGRFITCEVFGTFHYAEIAVMWVADQFVDILGLTDIISEFSFYTKELSCSLFLSSYTVISLLNYNDIPSEALDGSALMQCTLRVGENTNSSIYFEAVNGIRKCFGLSRRTPINYCAGEHDLCLELPAKTLFEKLRLGEELYAQQYGFGKDLLKFFSRTVTVLLYKPKEFKFLKSTAKRNAWLRIPVSDLKSNGNSLETLNNAKAIAVKFKNVCDKISEMCFTNARLIRTMDLLHSDYLQCVMTAVDDFWVRDFEEQVDSALDIIMQAVNNLMTAKNGENGLDSDEFLQTLRRLFEILNGQIYHIADSGKLFFEVAQSHLSYSGQVDLVLHAYYGIVKEIIKSIYNGIGDKQSKLIPIVSFMPISQINSELFFNDLSSVKVDPKRLLNIQLPHDAWSVFHYHIPMLVHELYHYAAPLNRVLRNQTIGMLSVYHIIIGILEYTLDEISGKPIDTSDQKKNESAAVVDELQEGTTLECNVELIKRPLFMLVKNYVLTKRDCFAKCVKGMGDTAVLRDKMRNNLLDWLYFNKSDDSEFSFSVIWKELNKYIDSKRSYLLQHLNNGNNDENKDGDFLYSALRLALKRYEEQAKHFESYDEDSAQKYDHDFIAYNSMFEDAVNAVRLNYECQLDELLPDFATVYLLNLQPEAYLAQFAVFQENALRSPKSVREREDFTVRIGTVIDWLLCKLRPIDDARQLLDSFDKLQDSFIKLYVNSCEKKDDYDAIDVKNNREQAIKWFGVLREAFEEYVENFYIERDWMKCYVEYQIIPLVQQKNERLSGIVQKYYTELRQLDELKQYPLTDVIGSICQFQKQKLLRDLEPKQTNCPTEVYDSAMQAWDQLVDSAKAFFQQEKSSRQTTPEETVGSEEYPIWRNKDVLGKPLERMLYNAERLFVQISDLTAAMDAAHTYVFGSKIQPRMLWFRGIVNSAYHLLPSIMVQSINSAKAAETGKIASILGRKNGFESIYKTLRAEYEQFKYRADGAPEIYSAHRYKKIDYLALMQHYSQPTTLMDWSEDAFASLYFALEPWFEKNNKSVPQGDRSKDVAIYLFDPLLYNHARIEMIEELASSKGNTEETGKAKEHIKLCKQYEQIPNLSIDKNSEVFHDFTGEADASSEFMKKYYECSGSPENKTLRDCKEGLLNLPLAIYTSQINPRIRSQSGIFLAYNPLTVPMFSSCEENNMGLKSADFFNYMALDQIQRYYLADGDKKRVPFLRRLVIRNVCADALVELLKELGINRYRIYPELKELK